LVRPGCRGCRPCPIDQVKFLLRRLCSLDSSCHGAAFIQCIRSLVKLPKKCLEILGLRCQEDPFIDRFVFDRLGMFFEVLLDPVALQDCHPETVALSLHPHEGVDRQEMVVVEDFLVKILDYEYQYEKSPTAGNEKSGQVRHGGMPAAALPPFSPPISLLSGVWLLLPGNFPYSSEVPGMWGS